VRAFRRYRPGPYPGKITLFLPAENTGALEEDVPDDPTHGWGELSPLPVTIETVPGDHVSALAEPHVRCLPNGCAAASRRPVRREIPPLEAVPADSGVRQWPSSWSL
jgi:thioesterase domain-containing protein